MQEKISGPMGFAVIGAAVVILGLLGYFLFGQTQGGSSSDLALAAKQQAMRGAGASTAASAAGRYPAAGAGQQRDTTSSPVGRYPQQ